MRWGVYYVMDAESNRTPGTPIADCGLRSADSSGEETSDLRPQTSDAAPQTADFRPQTSDSPDNPQSAIPNPQSALDATWGLVLWLAAHDGECTSLAQVAEGIGVNRSTATRAMEKLIDAKILERTSDGGYEFGLVFAQAYARRLRFLNKRLDRVRLVQAAIGAELAVLTGERGSGFGVRDGQ